MMPPWKWLVGVVIVIILALVGTMAMVNNAYGEILGRIC
jgi:hypothetical protein